MRRIPLRLLLAISLVVVTCSSFWIASDLIFSAFARNLWMDYTCNVERQVRLVMNGGYYGNDYGDAVIGEMRALGNPISVPWDYKNSRDKLSLRLSNGNYHVLIFDAQGHPAGKSSTLYRDELMPPASAFELLQLRHEENALRTHSQNKSDFLHHRRSNQGVMRKILFGPAGIFSLFDNVYYNGEARNPLYYAGRWVRQQIKHLRAENFMSSLSDEEKERISEIVAKEQQVSDELDATGSSLFSPPQLLRVTYEISQDRHVFIAPLAERDKIIGFVEIVSSWAKIKQITYDLATQIAVINILLSLVMVVVAIVVSGELLEPLKSVVNAARSVSSGNLSARTSLPNGRNEFYAVGYSFDQMVNSLEEAFTEQRRFIGDASHELKTPITSLLGVAQVLSIINQQQGENPQMTKALTTMNKELDRMAALVRDLLLLSRSSELAMKLNTDPISVHELVEEACQASLSNTMQRHVERELDKDVWLLGDLSLLTRALRNLIDNALRYTPEDKKVTIVFHKVGEEACIEVRDEGCGIKAENLKDLGKRFYRTDSGRSRDKGGTGLGLAITRTIIERHHGHLDISSQVGVGTQMKIYLPLPSKEQLGEDKT